MTIPAGQSTVQWDHETVDDDFDEADFTVSVSIIDYTQSTARTGYAWDGTHATATVTDNDLPTVTVEAVKPYLAKGSRAAFTLTREGDLTVPLTVDLSYSIDGTRTSSSSNTNIPQTGFFQNGAPATVTFPVGDATAEIDEETWHTPYDAVRLDLTLADDDAYEVGDPGEASILFTGEGLPVVSIRSGTPEVDEGQNVVFNLSRTGSAESGLTVTLEMIRLGGEPVEITTTRDVTFEAGQQTAALTLATEDEETNDGNDWYRAELLPGNGYGVGLDARPYVAAVMVIDDDIPTVWLSPESGEHYESEDSRPAFTFHRDSYTSTKLEVFVALQTLRRFPEPHRDELAGSLRYAAFPRPLAGGESSSTWEFPPKFVGPLGGESRMVIVPLETGYGCDRGDVWPGLRWITCNLRPQYRIGTPSSGVITVHNNFVGILIEADQSEVDEGQAATFTLTRVGGTPYVRGLSQTVRVAATQNGEFISGSTPQTVTFTGYPDVQLEEAQQSVTVRIPTLDDTVYEADGAVTLTVLPAESLTENATAYEIGGAPGFNVPTSATIRVTDNDRPEMSISDVSAFESEGVIKFTVSVPAGPRDVSVDWATADGTGDTAAIAGEDYTAASGALTIPAGETTGTITVMVMDDDLHENDETLTVRLSGASDSGLVETSATGTIKNDDFDQEVEIWTLATDRNLTEGETAMFTLRRQPPDGGVPPPGFGVAPLTVNIGVSQDGDFIAGDPPATVTFPANHLYAQLRVPTEDDQTAEPNGSVTVSLADGAGYSRGGRNQATVNLQDNDVGISITGGDEVRENVESGITFTVSLSRAASKPVTVDVTTVDGTATSDDTVTATSLGRDFEAKSQTLTFEAGQTQKTFTVTLVDDTFDEPREEFTAQLGNASDNARLLVPTATGMISDDEEKLVLGVYRTRKRVAEDRGAPVDFLLELRPAANSGATASEFEVRVNWSLERGTAIPGADYVDASGKAIIPPGAATATVEVSLVDDELLEAIFETFSFRINGAFSADVDEDHESIEISIRDDDDAQADVAVATESVAEGADAEFTVSLSGALSTAPVEVTYAVSGTAGADDYTEPSGTLTIPALATSAAISITTLADDVEDDDETLVVTLTGATSHGRTLQVADTAAEATILDQGTLTVSITGGSATEGEEVQFTIAISPPPSYWVNVTYETVDPEGNVVGEARLGTDFQSTRGIALITGNDPSKTFTIGTIEDNLVEGDETFEVRIVDVNSRFVGAEYGPAIDIASHTAELTIIDDDVRPTNVTLTVTPDSVSETADGTPLSVTATLDGDGRLLERLPVALSVADGTAAEGEDYTAVPVMLYIPSGQASATGPVVLFPVDDLVAGGDKTVQVTGAAAGMTATPATVTITDNETPPTGVALTVSPGEVREDAGATGLEVTATLTGGDRRPVDTEVRLTVEGVSLPAEQAEGGPTTGATGADFAVDGVTLTIPAGEMTGTATLSLTPTDDPIAEGDERAQVTGAADGLTVTPAPVTIVDDDRETTGIELSVTPSEVKEDAGATDLAVTATLIDGDARGVDTEVALSVSGVTATETLDYTAQTDVTLTIPAGRMSHTATLTLTPVDDGIRESAEQVAVRGTNASAGLPVSGARVTIADNDADATTITLSLDRDMIPEDGGAQRLTVTGTLNGDLRSVDTRVTLSLIGKTATDSDYTALPATLVIGAGQREGTATVVLDPTNDDIDEPDETLEVRGQARSVPTQRASSQQSVPQSSLTVSAAQVTITDDDTAGVTVTPTAFTVLEGLSRNYTVVLDTQPAADVTVSVSLPGGSDLSVSPTSLTFTASNWSVARTVAVTAGEDNDLADDGEVTIGHTASSADPLYAAATADSVTVTVTDDDDTVSVTFSAAAYSVAEGGTVEVTVTLGAAPEREVTIPIVKTGEGGISEDDYSGVPESVTFAATDTEKSFTFSATADEVDDDDESVALAFGTLPEGVSAGTTAASTVSITDDDVPDVSVSFGAATYSVDEDGTVDVTVTLDVAPEREVTIPIAKTDQGGVSENDYSGVPESLTFGATDTEKSFTFTAAADDVDDDDESVQLTLGTLPAGVSEGTTNTATVTITDDDVPAVTVSYGAATYTAAEGGTVDVTVTLDVAPEREVTIPIVKTDEGGITQDDYSGVPESLTFAATDTEKSFTFSATADDVDDDDESVALAFGTLPDGVSAGTTSASTVTITDDDVPDVTVSFGAATYSVDEDGTVDVTVTMDVAPEREVTIPIAKTDEGGITQDDYSGVPESLTFGATDTEKSFTFSATADEVDDDEESVALAFGTLPDRVSAGTTIASTVTITDDDVPAGTVSLVLTPATIDESGSSNVSTVTATLATASSADTTVTISAPQDAPVTLSSNKTLTIVKGATTSTGEVTITAVNDAVYTGDREVTVSGAASNKVGVANPEDATLTITDDEVRPVTVSFGQATYSVAEDGTVDVTVTLDVAPEREVTIPIVKTDEGGITQDDYSGVPESLTFAATDTEKSFTFSATADEVDDDDESVALAFGTLPAGVTAGTNIASTVSITDDDAPAGTVSLVLTPATIDESGTSNVSTVTATLATVSSADTTVTISAPQDAPVTLSSNKTLTIVKGATTSTGEVTITAVNDAVYTGDREVTVSGAASNTVGVANAEDATLTITDDEVRPVTVSFGAATYSVAEGGTVDVTVTLDAAPEREVTIPIVKADQGGITQDDYSGVPESLTFAATDTEKSFTFSATADEVDDDDESVKLTLGTLPTGVTAGTIAASTVTITDDDVPAVTVSYGAATYAVAEGSNVTVKVTLSAAPERTVTIPLTATNQAGTTDSDYSGVPASVTLGAAETEKSFDFAAAADDVDDDGESVALAFGTLPDGVTAGTTSVSTVSITDDTRGVTIDPTSFTVIAGRTNSYSVVLDTQPTAGVTVTVSGHVNTDLSLDKTSLTFTADNWKTAQTVTVTADENAVARSVTLSHAISGADYGSVSADDATVNIVAAPSSITIQVGVTVSQQRLSVVEGGSQDYSLVLNTVPTGDVTVDITLPSGTDLSLDSATLTFTTANWSTPQTITVSADEDDDAAADDPVQISHTISGGGYDNTPVPDVRVTITENDLFDAEATYRVLTRYGSPTEVELSEYIADGVTGVTFALESCDDTRSDYYDSAAVEDGKLRLASNTLGHIHGENTRGETVCTVTATSADGYEEREFRLYMVSDRTPTPLLVGDLTLVEARPTELDVQVALPEGAIAYIRLAWRKPGGQPIFRVVSGVTDETVLTIPGLEAGIEYDVRAYLMTFQSFDLYRAGNTGPERTLIPEGSPAVKWVTNLASSGLGKSQTITTRSAYGTSVSIEDVEALEDVGSMSFDVTLDQASTDVVTLDWATSDGTAEAPGDYEATTSGQLTFAAGQTKQTLEVTIVDDAVDEAEEETFTVTLSNAVNADLGVASATGTITDNDLPDVTVSFGSATYSVAEGSSLTVKVTLSAAPERSVTIPLTATNQGGASEADYSGIPANVVFNSGETEQTFTVAATQDTVDDDGESVKLTFGTLPAQVTGGTTDEAVVSITDDDAPASVAVSFGQSTYGVAEGSAVTITVQLDDDPEKTVTVPLSAAGQNGASAADYSGVPASVVFNSGDTSKSFTFSAAADGVDDDGESVKLTFGALPAQVTEGTADEAVVSITDDDLPDVTVSFGAAAYSVAEGGTVDVTVTLDAAPEREVTIRITAADQGGASASDYSGVPASLTFGATDTEKSFTFSATQDAVDDDGEGVGLAFGTLPAQVTGGTADEAVVSITDDDAPASVAVSFGQSTYSVAEGSEVTITVQLDDDPEKTVTVPLSAAGQNGASADDYSGVPASVVFNSGDTSKSFTFSAAADSVDDDGESVKLTFGTLPTGVTAGTTTASTISITDDDVPAVTVSFGAATYSVAEGGTVDVTVTLDDAPEREVTIRITAADQGGASASDYSGLPASLTFGAADTSKSFTFSATQDAVDDDGESVGLAFGTLPAQVTGGTTDEAVVSITDDDAPASVAVSFGQSTYGVAEGSAVTITVQLDDDPEKTVTVPLSAAGQNGASADDYSGVPASVTFNSGDTSKSFTFSAAADDVDDDGESVKLTFGTLPTGVTAGTTAASTVTITDDDVPSVTVSFGQSTFTVAEGSSVTVKVVLSADPERTVTVPLTPANQGGASDSDYSGVPESVVFNSGDTEKSFTFSAAADDVDDDGESVKLTLGALPTGVTAGTADEATVSITDDDVPAVTVGFGQSTYTVAEGSSVTVKVVLSADPERTVTVPLTPANQGGASDSDYSGVPASVVFNSGDTEQSFTFSAAADAVDDDGESVKLTFGALPTGVTAGTTSASTVTITDDDVPAGAVSLVLTPATIDESGSSNVSTVTATLATASSADTTVTISAPQDAPVTLSSNKTLTIVKGATTSTGEVTITAVNDAVYTGDREVTVSGAASNTVGVASPEDATLTITDDEVRPVTVSFGAATYTVAEGGTVEVTVTLNAAPEREVTIPITATAQGGAGVDDYSGVPASLTFGAADTSKSFTFSAAEDDVDDDGESVKLAFGTLPAQVTGGATDEAVVSITDDDAPASVAVSFGQSSYSATEGGNNAQVTVLLSSQPQSTVDIPLTATGSSGATEDDWSGVPASLTFNPGDTSQTFTVIATDDDVEDNGEMVQLGLGDLPHGFEAGEPATATITIMNDDTEGTPDSACLGAVWCATLTFSSEGSLHYDDHRQTFLGWHYRADSVSNTGATLSDSNFTYREKDYSFIGIWVFPAPRDRSSCTSELQLNIHNSSDGLLADLDLFESLDASKGLKLIVDDNLEFPITVDTKRHPHMMGFLHPYFYSIRAGSTVALRIEETDIASSGGDGAAGDALAKPRCVHVSSYPHNTPETGLVGLEITWQKPSLDGSPNILSGAANVDSYKVQWKKKVDSWDDPDDVSEGRASGEYYSIIGLTEGVEYSVRVIATNGFGDSPWSEEATGSPTEVVRPGLSAATVNGETLTLAFDEALDVGSVPAATASFEVIIAGTTRDVVGVTVEGSAVVLTLASAVAPDDEVQLNYICPWYIEQPCIQDLVGNFVLTFIGQSVTNDTEAAAQAQAAEEVTPLTASFSDVPASHDGQSSFTFRIAFSEAIATSYEVVRDQALEVTGGSVSQARRVDGRSDLWEITVEPGSNAAVAVTLRPDLACDAEGAICTGDGKRLSNGLALLVPGPVVRQEPEPNRPAAGAPTISGAVQVGETLRASTSGITDADGLDNAVFTYQWIAGGADIPAATSATYTLGASDQGKTIKVRVNFTDDAGNQETLTSAATAAVAGAPAEPLTVTLENTPESHNGADAFTFELRFSEEVELSYRTLRDHSFTVTGGAVTSVSRKERESNLRWEITILPDSDADVTVVLPVTTDCDDPGAICTKEDRRPLSNLLELTVSGPGG